MNRETKSFSERLLSWCCKAEFVEEILGDLAEYKEELLAKPKWKREVFYWFHVLNFLQPWSLKKIEGNQQLNQYGMFKNYIKTSFRSLKNNALFSAINVVGLAISMSIGILMILLISELKSFDDFHENSESIYRISSNKLMYGQEMNMSSSSYFVGSEVGKQVPGIAHQVIMREGVSADIRMPSGLIHLSGIYSTDDFFNVFSFKLKQGNPETVLDGPNKIVLTESAAKKLFGNEEAYGKTLDFQSTGGWQTRQIQAVVVGIMEDLPANTHLQFEALVSMDTYDQPATGTGWNVNYKNDPQDFQNNYVYLLLNENTSPEDVEVSMKQIVAGYNETQDEPLTHFLQPMNSIVTSDIYENKLGPRFSGSQLNIMLVLTLVVLLSACFNYTNLSLARSLRRSKEIGIRKVSGARRSQVFTQFIVEAVILSLLALLVGLGMFAIIKPTFLNLPNPASSGHNMFSLSIGWRQAVYFVVFTILVGCIAGFMPAYFLSKLKSTVIFSDASKIKVFAGLNLRRLLSVLQFSLSIGLIMCAVIVNKQYQFALNYDIGLDTENIVNIKVKGDYLDLLENEYSKISQVSAMSTSMMTMGTGNGELALVQPDDKSEQVMLFWNAIDHRYLEMHAIELLAGEGFLNPMLPGESRERVILNEHALLSLNLGTPEEAVGKFIHMRGYWGARLQIVGVAKNFINVSINTQGQGEIMMNKSFAFVERLHGQNDGLLGVKFTGSDLVGLMQKLEAGYKLHDGESSFEAKFYKDDIAKTYASQKTTFTLISFLAFLAISISVLGLLGMAVFTTESRMKEISVRKVLGASVRHLMFILSKSFVWMLLIAGTISIPIAYYVVDEKLLMTYDYKATIGIVELLSGFVIVLLIGGVSIVWEIRKAAIQNPADLLRNE
ncbi:ABC transporter permease [Roseivirga sp.]|uniref:ABC transporter permease n=1 Tax=Roseivirga sp. TaxID=1964215 RepID=UPI003B8D0165